MNIVLNSKPVDALSIILHRSQSEIVGRDWVKRLKGLLSRQLFEIVIQASVGNKIIAREGLSAMRKNVTAKCYGGDVSRKMKLLNKQASLFCFDGLLFVLIALDVHVYLLYDSIFVSRFSSTHFLERGQEADESHWRC